MKSLFPVICRCKKCAAQQKMLMEMAKQPGAIDKLLGKSAAMAGEAGKEG